MVKMLDSKGLEAKVIICSICGHHFTIDQEPCKHLLETANECKGWLTDIDKHTISLVSEPADFWDSSEAPMFLSQECLAEDWNSEEDSIWDEKNAKNK